MKLFIKENWFKIGALLFLAITALSAGWYYLTFRPQQDRATFQQTVTTQSQANDQTTAKTQQLQDCINKTKQDFADSYANLCTYYQTNQNQLGNPNWQCPLKLYGNANPAYATMVKQEEDAISLCSTLYK